jgi:DNA polymerase-1
MKKLYLIDGFSLAFRAYYALPPEMMNREGHFTNVLHGFLNILYNIINEEKPDYFAVVFDRKEPTRRHKSYKEYKANRPEAPEPFKMQVDPLKDIIRSIDVPLIELAGHEADDIIGTIAKQASEQKLEVRILTGDRDAFQLIDKHITVIYPKKGIRETQEITPAVFAEKYEGLKPMQIIDLKALEGDASDNIPGVKGVGVKTATELLKKFGSLDQIYKNLAKIERETLRQKLEEDKKNAYLSQDLATIDLDVPIKEKLKDLEFKEAHWEKALPQLKRFELNALMKRLGLTEVQGELAIGKKEEKEEPVVPEGGIPGSFEVALMKFLLNQDRAVTNEEITAEEIAQKDHYYKELKKQGLEKVFNEIDMPLQPILLQMQKDGIKVNLEYLKEFSKECEKEIAKIEKQIYKLAGEEFNINSPKQLGVILFEKLKLPTAKKTKTGFSTDSSVLEGLAEQKHDIAQKILDYRLIAKLKSTYIDALPEHMDDKGFVHSFLSQTVAATGRLSSQDPNLQNIPTRSEMGKRVRAAFIPREKNGYILSADYSQIELRILAHVANVKKLIEAYASNRDIHTATASEIFNVPYEKVDSTLRSHAKAINFGIIYGMGPLALSKQTGVTMTQAKEFIAKYFERYPEIKKYMDDTKAFAHKNLYVETFLGRKRFLKDINSKNPMMAANAERQAINAPIQGAAADLVKMAMLAIHDMLEKNKFKSKMILQVHDELLFDVRADELAKLEPMVKHAMENVLKLKVPMLVECHHGKNWLEASK